MLGRFYKHNVSVLQKKKGVIIPVYRPSHPVDPEHYLPCQHCLGFYAKEDLWKHGCKVQETSHEPDEGEPPVKKTRKSYVKGSKCLLPCSTELSGKFAKNVLAGLRDGDESRLIKSDRLILKLTEKFTAKLGHDEEQYCYIRTKLREVARLVVKYRELTTRKNASLTDMIDPLHFKDVVRAASNSRV